MLPGWMVGGVHQGVVGGKIPEKTDSIAKEVVWAAGSVWFEKR